MINREGTYSIEPLPDYRRRAFGY